MRRYLGAGLTALSLLAALPLQADDAMGDKHPMMMEKKLEKMTKELDLTPDQQARVKAVLEEQKPKMQALHEQKKKLAEETHQRIESVLTEEQKAKFAEMKRERHGMKGHHGKKGSRHGPHGDR